MLLYKTALAAKLLNDKLPESLAYWQNFLLNNRKLNRNPAYRIPCNKLSGDTVYSEEELLHFIEWEEYRKLNSIKLSRNMTLDKSNFDFYHSNKRFSKEFKANFLIDIDEKTGKPFITLTIPHPINVYKLTIGQAQSLRNNLDEYINKIK